MLHLYSVEFYSTTKKSEILSFAGKWMELKDIIIEVSQSKKAKRPHTSTAIL
jgi:hypothetical protein